jgi:Cu(I)/Ag(I) efflux system membrane protein CusA/SilA
LEADGFLQQASADDRDRLVNDAAMKALARFDDVQRELALRRYREFEHELGSALVRVGVTETVQRFGRSGNLHWPAGIDEQTSIDELSGRLASEHGSWLARNPTPEEVSRLCLEAARWLAEAGAPVDPTRALALKESLAANIYRQAAEAVGAEPRTFAGEVLRVVQEQRTKLWHDHILQVNWELFDHGTAAYTGLAAEEIVKAARGRRLTGSAPHGGEAERFVAEALKAESGQDVDNRALSTLVPLREQLTKDFRRWVFLWPRQSGPKGDLVDDEMGRVLQVPGWSNIFTQPIINRIEMLSTGVRTDIGVKVFGPDLAVIDRVCKQVEEALKPLNGARDVVAAPIMGKGYLEITVDRQRAARYGVSVADVQDTIEVALGGRVVTQTVEERSRFPVRIRYARAYREDEEAVRGLLVSSSGLSSQTPMVPAPDATGAGMASPQPSTGAFGDRPSASEHAAPRGTAVQVPLSAVADVRVVEGPAMIKSENGRLLNHVTLNVRGRDMVGFVDEARRVVAEKVRLPEGVYLGWSGEFEHQVRAAQTLRFVFPAVIVLIFVILYLTYKDLADAALMMLAVPEALAGGVFFMVLFPKILHGWDSPPMDFSVAVWVGFIACFGMATETGIIMLVYLREAVDKRGGLENIHSLDELRQAVIEGAVHRLRPKLLTEGVAIIAIFPMVFATGVGGEILAPMALPVLGGLLISDEVVDIFLPVRFYWVRRARWLKFHALRTAHVNELASHREAARR